MTQKTKRGNTAAIKRNATKIKKQQGITHHQALDIAVQEEGFSNFRNYIYNNSERPAKRKRSGTKDPVELPNPLILSYSMLGDHSGKRPNAKAPIAMHQKLGNLLKELHSATKYNKRGKTAISSIKSTLDNWIQLEYTSKEELSDEVFFTIYYGSTDFSSDPWPTEKRKKELQQLVKSVRAILKRAYHDCKPLQNLNKKLDTVVNAINKWPINNQVKGLKEIKGQIPAGTLVYLKKYHKNPAIVLSHDAINNLIRCYEDAGPTMMSREEITVAKNQSEAKTFQPMRLALPYGKWFCEDGTQVLFNRDYIPIWSRDKSGKVSQIDPNSEIIHNDEPEFFFGDGSTPWSGDQSTLVRCKNILNSWLIGRKKSLLVEALNDSIKAGNANNLRFKKY